MNDEFIRSAEVVRVIDGDTLRCSIDLGWGMSKIEDVRIAGVDTPETRGPRSGSEAMAGQFVTGVVSGLVQKYGNKVVIRSKEFSLGKYGRCIADVFFVGGTKSLADHLLDQKLAWPIDLNGSMKGERDLDLLTGIPESWRG